MITTKDLAGGLGRNLDIIRAQTKDLSHADSLLQPPFRGNCLNWVLGHIADARSGMLRSLGQEPILSAAQSARYGYGSEPVCGKEEGILKLGELLAVLESAQQGLAARLEAITQDELATEMESFLGTTTLAQLLFFLYWHESYHVGQTEMLRQLAGKGDAVI
jgi:uncharacterized damage-inducible protein DinB